MSEDTDTDRKTIFLKFLNLILKEHDHDEIENITDFCMDRRDLIKDTNIDLIKGMDFLFPPYNKYKVAYYKKSPNWVINVCRGIAKMSGYKLYGKRVNRISHTDKGEKIRLELYYYYIKEL